MKLLVTAIRFTNNGANYCGAPDGSRAIEIDLNNFHTVTIDRYGEFFRFKTDNPRGTMTETETTIARLVCSACASYILGDDPETVSYAEIAAIEDLAKTRIDWSAYSEGTGEEREAELFDHIAHFQDF